MTSAQSILESEPFPPSLTVFVRQFVNRSRHLRLIHASGAALAFALIWTLAWALVDRFMPTPAWFRSVLLLIELAAVAILLFRPIRKLFSHDIPWHQAAAAIEERDPQFGGGLQTALSQLLMPVQQRGSAAMLEQVVGQTAARASSVDPRLLLPSSPALRPGAVAAATLITMCLLLPLSWLNLPRLLKRELMPFSNAPPVTTTRLFVSPGSVDVIEGDPMKITVRAERLGDSQPLLQWRTDDPVFASAVMLPEPGGFAYAFNSIDRPLIYRVTGGDATSPLFQVRVIPRPAVRQMSVSYAYPDWTELPPKGPALSTGDLDAPAGTIATVSIVGSEPLAKASATFDNTRIESTASVDPSVRLLAIPIRKSGPWHLQLTSSSGISANGPSQMTLHAIAPQPPVAKLRLPADEDELRLHPRDVLTLGYEAKDQYALARISAEIAVNSLPPLVIAIPLGANHRSQSAAFDVDLAQLAVNLGDVVTINLLARNKAGLSGASKPCRIIVSPRSIDLNAEQRLTELHEAERLARLLHAETAASATALEQSPPGDDKDNRDEQIGPHLAAADGVTADLSRELLRALAHSSTPELASALVWMVDANQRAASGLEAADNAVLTEMRDPLLNRLHRLTDETSLLQQSLDAFWHGEAAAQVLAESEDAKADEARAATLGEPQAQAVRVSAERSLADEQIVCKRLGIDPHAADVEARLQSLVQQSVQVSQRFGPVDFASAAAEWSSAGPEAGAGLVARLTIASEAEAVRPEGDFIWARDLQLSARAARRIDTANALPAGARAEYPAALRSLQQLNALRTNRTPIAQLAQPLKAADAARLQMRRWAGDEDASTQPVDKQTAMDPERVALEAAAAAAEQKLEQNQRLEHATTMPADDSAPLDLPQTPGNTDRDTPNELPATPAEVEKLKQTIATARRLERLTAEQRILRRQTAAASDAELRELAKQQQALTDAIENARPEQAQSDSHPPTADQSAASQSGQTPAEQTSPDQSARNDSAPNEAPPNAALNHGSPPEQQPDQPQDDSPRDSREAAMNAIRSAQERLMEMPKEIERAREAEAQQHDAEQIADQARQQADAQDPDAKGAAEQMAADSRGAADAAKAKAAAAQVSPDESSDVSAALRRFAPESTPAVEAIDQQLTPALTTMRQTQAAGDHEGNQRSAQQATEAVAQVQRLLNDGLQSLLKRDALTTAKFFSSKAAQALARPQPDRALAVRLQRGASAALEQAWDDALHQAAGQRLARMPSMAAILRIYPADGETLAPASMGAEPAPAEREWGTLRQQRPDDLSAASHEIDPPEYQDALRVYFRDLAHADTAEKQ